MLRIAYRIPAVRSYIDRLYDLSLLDPMLAEYGIRSRRGFDISLNEHFSTVLADINGYEGQVKRAPVLTSPYLALLFFDLSNVKQVNDSLGHDRGDGLLEYVADYLSSVKRATDGIARWGGDEFGITMPFTPYETAKHVVNRWARGLLNNLPSEYDPYFGVYGGLVEFSRGAYEKGILTPKDLVREADRRLYRARDLRGNRRICIVGENDELVS